MTYNNFCRWNGRQCPGVAQFGSALEWGSRGREFDSRHSDQRWLSETAKAESSRIRLFLLVIYSQRISRGRTCPARSAKAITRQRVTAANLRAVYMRPLRRSKKQKAAYLKRDKRLLAGVEGFEPSARGFGDRCSTN